MRHQVVHAVVGPDRHGVVQHAVGVARACGHVLLRAERPEQLDLAGVGPGTVVHVPFTDRLFGATWSEALAAFGRTAASVRVLGAGLSVTLHDVPHSLEDPLQQERAEAYRGVVGCARGVVVNSGVELALLEAWHAVDGDTRLDDLHALTVVPLPVPAAPSRPVGGPERPGTIGVLGFLYPDRGYEDVIDAAPHATTVTAIGEPSAGHDDLVARYAERARRRGVGWRNTGYVPDDHLADLLRTVAVPVAPNRRVTASASIDTWLAHGRRPLVADGAYAREIDAARPGCLVRYDPTDRTALPRLFRQALVDPSSTRLPPGVDTGPGIGEVADAYRAHLRRCRPARPVRVGAGLVVPGNRWDLLVAEPMPAATRVSVVVPYYRQQRQLELLLAALGRQTHPSSQLQVIVADDGSPEPPRIPGNAGLDVTVVRQDDLGFRAAAARNRGAAAADGDVLVFLDADTVPEAGFVAELARLPAVCPDAVTVGRRRHADLAGLAPDSVPGCLPPAGRAELPEPEWLRDAYRRSHDLLDLDARSYRYVISAVLALPRALFRHVGGFDERFVGYGGEDWELAHRLRVAGAVVAHVPGAVAWHDGPDWGQRDLAPELRTRQKDLETRRLAELLPDPGARGGPGPWEYPATVVRLAARRTPAGQDWARDPERRLDARVYFADDPPTPPDVLARASFQVDAPGLFDPACLPEALTLADRHGRVSVGDVRVSGAWAVNRAARHGLLDGPGADALHGRQRRSGQPRSPSAASRSA